MTTECHKIDELMMQFLHQELDADPEQQVRSHIDGCARCGAELAGRQRTRSAFRWLPDADVPASVTARLLHEAARRPASADESSGTWAWLVGLFRPIAAHPALAAAASI